MNHYIVGIDPGLTGALAFLDLEGVLLHVADMPVAANEVTGAGLLSVLKEWEDFAEKRSPNGITVVVEQLAAYPKNGSIGNFKVGFSYGVILGVVAARWQVERVRPGVWKRVMGVTADKETSRKRALDLWPSSTELFKRKKDSGRAEAALIARWFYEKGTRS